MGAAPIFGCSSPANWQPTVAGRTVVCSLHLSLPCAPLTSDESRSTLCRMDGEPGCPSTVASTQAMARGCEIGSSLSASIAIMRVVGGVLRCHLPFLSLRVIYRGRWKRSVTGGSTSRIVVTCASGSAKVSTAITPEGKDGDCTGGRVLTELGSDAVGLTLAIRLAKASRASSSDTGGKASRKSLRAR
jgi:hypothetical protein